MRATAASSPRSPRGGISSSSRPWCRRRLRRPERARRRPVRGRHAGTRARRRAARRALRGEGARLGARSSARAGRPSARARCLALPRPRTGRAAVSLPARERRSHAAARRARPRGLSRARHDRSTMLPARRSTRVPACSASATRVAPRSTGWRETGDPEAFSFPVARLDGLDFSFSGLKTALLYPCATSATRPSRARQTSPRPTSGRSCGRSSSRRLAAAEQAGPRDRRRGRRRRGQLRAPRSASRRPLRAARVVHRQRRDDRVRRPVRQEPRLSSLP